MTSRTKAYLALLGNAAIWGWAVPLAKRGFAETGPMTFLFYRYVFATLAGLPILVIFWKKMKTSIRNLPELIILGTFSNILAHWLLYTGLKLSSALETSLLTTLIPIFISVAGAIFLKEVITKREKAGTLLAFLGSIIIVLEPLWLNSQKLSFSHALGNLMVVGYNISWTVAALWMKKVAEKYHPFTLVYSFFVVSLIGFLPLALLENPQLFTQNYLNLPNAFLASFYMGTLGSLGAFYLYQYGQKLIEASEASLFTYLTTIFSVFLAIFWLGEKLTLPFIAGGIIVIIGIAAAESRRKKQVTKFA